MTSGWKLALATAISLLAPTSASGDGPSASRSRSPVEHVIVVIGENHTFDAVFATFQPARGQTVRNLLSQGIVLADGSPGPRFSVAAQSTADGSAGYSIDPPRTGSYARLPPPGARGLPGHSQAEPDRRFPPDLPNGPYSIDRYVSPSSAVGDPVHRFFEMWQQVSANRKDLFVWTACGAAGRPGPPAAGGTSCDPAQGSMSMGYHDMAGGNLAGLQTLARTYALSDNYHQSIMGGSMANYIALVTGDVATHVGGEPPPEHGGDLRSPAYVNCSDVKQPRVGSIRGFLDSRGVPHRCAPGTWYLVNNLPPPFDRKGSSASPGSAGSRARPQPAALRTIAEALQQAGISWRYYAGGRESGVGYCAVCDPLSYFSAVATSDTLRSGLVDVGALARDLRDDPRKFPAVAFVRPSEATSGHPGYSHIGSFEAFVLDVVARVRANPGLWRRTALLVIFDEGGGYYDSGYIQPLDFFGDGTRVPLIAVSPYARPGHVDHVYLDHASILKFIEWNWGLQPLSARSRDGLPNPRQDGPDPYVPVNGPAVGDLRSLFDFSRSRP